ncbi:hypothetical protein [Enterococcus faecalis]|uniref:hypothetical protein n=1 Tax=Enterococcus faecalis TaxID=1351 RepID=UPI003B9FA750
MNLKVKNIFATVLCCSLFASSLNGISAIAETTHLSTEAKALEEKTQVDSLPTVQGNSASLIPTLSTILSMAPQSEEPALEEKSSIEVGIDGIDNQEQEVNRLTRATKTVDIPAKTYKLAFIDEDGSYIDPAKVSITGDVMKVEPQGTSGKVGEIVTANVGNFKEMTVPKVTLADDDSTGNTGFSGIQNSKIVLPGYYETPQVTPNKYYTGATFPMAQAQRISLDTGEVKATDDTGARFMMRIGTSPKQYEFSQNYWVPDTSITWFVKALAWQLLLAPTITLLPMTPYIIMCPNAESVCIFMMAQARYCQRILQAIIRVYPPQLWIQKIIILKRQRLCRKIIRQMVVILNLKVGTKGQRNQILMQCR